MDIPATVVVGVKGGHIPKSVLLSLPILLIVLAIAVIGMTVAGENTPPTVVMHTPGEGADLGLTVIVSGNATDGEGFNISAYVEARWNDWEWFLLPATPADEGRSIIFGEMVNLNWHSPGEHLLQVRAFDGELYSEVAQVTVTVRDLADIVVMPSDITLDPEDARAGDGAKFSVVVRNQGGESVTGVEVVLRMNGSELGRRVIDSIDPHSQAVTVFDVNLERGNFSIVASAFSLQPVEEKSVANNRAERFFKIPAPRDVEDDRSTLLFTFGIALLIIVVLLGVFVLYSVVVSRKD